MRSGSGLARVGVESPVPALRLISVGGEVLLGSFRAASWVVAAAACAQPPSSQLPLLSSLLRVASREPCKACRAPKAFSLEHHGSHHL